MAAGKDSKKSEDIDELFLLQSIKEQEQPKEQPPTASSAEKIGDSCTLNGKTRRCKRAGQTQADECRLQFHVPAKE
jgi:hypothetical protein